MARKKDLAEKQTDKLLEELEKIIAAEYSAALDDVQAKYDRFAEKFSEQDKKKKHDLADGKITKQEYDSWRVSKLASGQRYQELINTLASDLAKVDQKAMSIVNGYMPDAYALNYNYETYDIEQNAQANTSFTLYSRETVERLFKEGEISLPKRKVDIPVDELWNKKHLNSAVLQGVLQGKSIPEISKSLQQVTDMDRRAAVRNARTMMTGAQNAGRMDAFDRAISLGINVQKEWMATLDSRTRDSHQHLDGERVEYDKKFSNGLRYPGDPEGAAEEVYNCRCTLVPYYPDYEDITEKRMTYDEWVERKQGSQKQESFDRNKVQYSDRGKALRDQLEKGGVEWREVHLLQNQLSEKEIINRLAGGDKTKGSCYSLACAYAGNKNGLDVVDFRGGKSQDYFAQAYYAMYRFDWINVKIEHKGGINPAKSLLKQMQEGKEYIFTTGRHSAIVRLINGEMQYLELQSATDSGWHSFEQDVVYYKGTKYERLLHYTVSDTLKNRFGCGSRAVSDSTLIDIDVFKNSDEFRDLLGYINTAEDQQKKGVSGGIK